MEQLTTEQGGHSLTTLQRNTVDLSKQIKGWGDDVDLEKRPGVPMDKAPLIGSETLYPDIEPQIPKAKVHKSTEHMKMPPVFGNVCPPKGLSGRLRDHAFQFSEGQARHWLYLVLADRIDMLEVLLSDIARGEIPNVPKEMGMSAMWKYNKKAVVKWSAIGVGALVFGAWLMRSRRRA